jgi:glycosyltransferase involved in cell wall biosynthesis
MQSRIDPLLLANNASDCMVPAKIMPRKRALICHERFLPRFGADRVLIIIGKALAADGWGVDFMGQHFQVNLAAETGGTTIGIPPAEVYAKFDEQTSAWLKEWNTKAKAGLDCYDLVVVGGWPFFSSIPLFRAACDAVVFIDCGVVPNDGFPRETIDVLDRLRELRRRNLPYCTHIAANSAFTLETQSRADAGKGPLLRAVLNGIDHLPEAGGAAAAPDPISMRVLSEATAAGKKLMLLLGRYEQHGYKNSPAALRLLQQVLTLEPQATLLVLERAADLGIDRSLKSHVICLGHPDDATLAWIMSQAHLGVSMSLWEGFNLPIAEMYRQRRPALCFDLAAHPEVVLRPWFLCDDLEGMAGKAAIALCGHSNMARISAEDARIYSARFTWARFMQELKQFTGFQ